MRAGGGPALPVTGRALDLYEEITMKLYQLIDHLLRCERRIRHVYLTLSERADFPSEMRAF